MATKVIRSRGPTSTMRDGKGPLDLLKETVNEFLTDNCPHLAASISYYLLFSLFPLTLAAVSILGFVASGTNEEQIIKWITDFFAVSSEYVQRNLEGVVNAREATGAVATIGLLWGGSMVFNALRKSINTAWGVKEPRPFIHDRRVEVTLMAVFGTLFLLSFGLSTALNILQRMDVHWMNGSVLWQFGTASAFLVISFLAFLFLYWFVPNAKVSISHVWPGALLAALAFEITKQVFVWFMANFVNYSMIYGSIGSLIALLVWIYISSMIMLFGAKLTSVYSKVVMARAREVRPKKVRERGQRRVPATSTILLGVAALGAISVGALRRLTPKKG